MYSKKDFRRFIKEEHIDSDEYRTQFRRDLARIIHSHGFRRLAGKTQLFPKYESDFFRTRLTHSLEVAQIAKSIAIYLNKDIKNPSFKIDLDLVELAGLAHDLGHPPFGHQGEEILAECMINHGGFEGNAQTLRILSKIEKKVHDGDLFRAGFLDQGVDRRGGLNLTARSLASIIKYDSNIKEQISKRDPKQNKFIYKGYYDEEKDVVNFVKRNILSNQHSKLKTIECQIMDISDDITYSTYDLEDAFKAGFITPLDMLIQDDDFYIKISKEINNLTSESEIYKNYSVINSEDVKDILSDLVKFMFDLPDDLLVGIKNLKQEDLSKEEYLFLGQQYTSKYNKLFVNNGYVRNNFSSQLIKNSIKGVHININPTEPLLSNIWIDESTFFRIEILKRIAFKTQILSPKLKANEERGKRIVRKIFESLDPKKHLEAPPLLPDDFKTIYNQNDDIFHKYRTICDFISCMTDQYAVEFYGRLTSKSPSSIFRPI